MRAIEFRGLRITGSGFVYGSLVHDIIAEKYYITSGHVYKNQIEVMTTNCYEVFPDSVGQYTENRDHLLKKIYEGDIVTRGKYKTTYKVRWNNYLWNGISKEGDEYGSYQCGIYHNTEYDKLNNKIEVIGNIHENLELYR